MITSITIIIIGFIATALYTEAFVPIVGPKTSCLNCRIRSSEVSLFSHLTPPTKNDNEEITNSRRNFLSTATVAVATTTIPLQSSASTSTDKQLNLSNEELKKIIESDMVDKSFLVSADITRSVYDESATFTDEIDEYTMDKWIKGTKSLFVASGSRVSLVGDIDVSTKAVSFRFSEDLMFNIPFKPVCSLSGKVVLERDENTGLITSYREYWDQSVNEVLKTAKFGKKA